MNAEMIVLRLLHIFTGIFWAGGVMYLAFFVLPAIKALGPDGAKFMQQLTRTRNMPIVLSANGLVTVLVGIRLMQIDSGNFKAAWFSTNTGIAISIGALSALGALIIGIGFNRPRAARMASISQSIADSGKAPTNEQVEQLTKLKNQLLKGVHIMAWHLLVAVLMMAVARYL